MIDGETLPLLSEEHLLDTLGLKLGPALKIRSQVQKHRFWLEMQSRATKDRIWRDYLMYEDKSWIKVYLHDRLFIQLHVRRFYKYPWWVFYGLCVEAYFHKWQKTIFALGYYPKILTQ